MPLDVDRRGTPSAGNANSGEGTRRIADCHVGRCRVVCRRFGPSPRPADQGPTGRVSALDPNHATPVAALSSDLERPISFRMFSADRRRRGL